LEKKSCQFGTFFSNENPTIFLEFYRIEIIIFRSKFGEISPHKKKTTALELGFTGACMFS